MLTSYENNPGEQPAKLVQLDSRGRLSLQRYTEYTTFRLTVEADGTIILIPSIVVPASMVVKVAVEA